MAKKKTAKKTTKKTAKKKVQVKKAGKKKITKKASAKKTRTQKTNKKKTAKKTANSKKSSVKSTSKVEVNKQALKAETVKKKTITEVEELSVQKVRQIERLIQKGAGWEGILSHIENAAIPYNMKASFEEKTAIKHPKMGIGYITSAENDRLRVLFSEGTKSLIMNYKK